MTSTAIITDLTTAITNGQGFVWEAPQTIGNGEVAVYLASGFGILAAPHEFSGAEYTVVCDDGVEYDCDSMFRSATEAVAFAESL